jgi:hypothetical protein
MERPHGPDAWRRTLARRLEIWSGHFGWALIGLLTLGTLAFFVTDGRFPELIVLAEASGAVLGYRTADRRSR